MIELYIIYNLIKMEFKEFVSDPATEILMLVLILVHKSVVGCVYVILLFVSMPHATYCNLCPM